tara:strand:- start:789 stop:1949 length:1161 start_codon:yes stop_codon:yes gene_type:complete
MNDMRSDQDGRQNKDRYSSHSRSDRVRSSSTRRDDRNLPSSIPSRGSYSSPLRRENSSNQVIRRNNPRYRSTEDRKQNYNKISKPKTNYVLAGDSSYTDPSQGVHQEPQDNDLVWGRHSTQAVLETGRPIHRIWCTSEIRSSPKFLQLLKEAKSSGVLVEEVTWARLGQITTGGVHQGIALQKAAADTLDLKTLIKGCAELGESPLLVALDGLTDPHNLGAIVRSAEALGAHGLVLPQRRSAGLTGSVAKVAAGALEHLPVARVVNLNRSLEALKKEGYTVIGLADEGDLTISEINLEGPLVVVTGSEGKGISLVTRRHCDQLVRIPLRGVTTSLNASVATALLLYEVARRGWMKEISGQAPSPKLVRAKYSSVLQEKVKENFSNA